MVDCKNTRPLEAKVNQFLVSKIPSKFINEGKKFFEPIETLSISSPFGARKLDDNTIQLHEAIDISRPHRWVTVINGANLQLAALPNLGTDFSDRSGYGLFAELTSEENRDWTIFVSHLDSLPLPIPSINNPYYNAYLENTNNGVITNDFFIKNSNKYKKIVEACVLSTNYEPIDFYSKRKKTAFRIKYVSYSFSRDLYNNKYDPEGDHVKINVQIIDKVTDDEAKRDKAKENLYNDIINKSKQRSYIFVCGDTGYSLGNHYHFELRYSCIRIDPLEAFDISNGGKFKDVFIRDLEFYCQ